MLHTLDRWLTLFCRFVVGCGFAVLIVAVLTQVLGRTIGSSPVWTEELTRFALLYVSAFGAGLSLASGELVNVDVVCEAFGNRASKIFRLVSAFLTALLCSVLIFPAWQFVKIGALQTSPALGVRMNWVHLSVFILLLVLALFATLRVLTIIFSQTEHTTVKDPVRRN